VIGRVTARIDGVTGLGVRLATPGVDSPGYLGLFERLWTMGTQNAVSRRLYRNAGGYVEDAVEQAGVSSGDRSVELTVEASPSNLAILRTLVAAVAAFEDFDLDAVADIRLAVDEACTGLIRSAVPGSRLRIVVDPANDAVVVRASARCVVNGSADNAVVKRDSFSWHVLNSLTDDVATFADGPATDGTQILGVSLTSRRVSLQR
jgi:serine/threonine-protein kinase RsbW